MNQTSDLLSSLGTTWRQIASLLPRVGLALLLLALGWMVARAARRAALGLCRLVKLDALAERAGVEGFLVQGGVEFTAVTLVGGAVYWLILFLTFATVLDTLVASAGQTLIDRLVNFVPNIVVAIVILMFGTVLARIVGSAAATYLNNIGAKSADAIAALARYAMLVFVIAMAVEQLALRSEILVPGFEIAFGAVCLALALAFGLGGREWAARVLDKFLKR